MNVPEDER